MNFKEEIVKKQKERYMELQRKLEFKNISNKEEKKVLLVIYYIII